MHEPHILVVGAGSVGRRHLRNFHTLGCDVSTFDPRPDRIEEAAGEVSLRNRYGTLEEALRDSGELSAAVIGSPTRFHPEQAVLALDAGLPVLLEKPPAMELAGAEAMSEAVRRSNLPLLLGYSYRWWPPVVELRRRVRAGDVGAVRSVRCVMSAHLADWHPWERYQDFFMASRELGGGAFLDESHFVDLMYWIFGVPDEVFASIERLSSLEIETDDTVDAWLAYPEGLRVTLHLDLYGRPHERSITVVGEDGTLAWSYEANSVRFARTGAGDWSEAPFSCERNEMFMGAALEFLAVLEGRQEPSCTIEDGRAVMRILEAMRESSATSRVVGLVEP
jgi:predicted dehydrogenase